MSAVDIFLAGVHAERAPWLAESILADWEIELKVNNWTLDGLQALCVRLAKAGWERCDVDDVRSGAIILKGRPGNLFAYRLSRTGKVLLQTGWMYRRLFEPKRAKR